MVFGDIKNPLAPQWLANNLFDQIYHFQLQLKSSVKIILEKIAMLYFFQVLLQEPALISVRKCSKISKKLLFRLTLVLACALSMPFCNEIYIYATVATNIFSFACMSLMNKQCFDSFLQFSQKSSGSKDGHLDVSREAASNYKQIQRHLLNQTNNSINRAKLPLTRYQRKYLCTYVQLVKVGYAW